MNLFVYPFDNLLRMSFPKQAKQVGVGTYSLGLTYFYATSLASRRVPPRYLSLGT